MHITYFTATADEDGKVNYRSDIYGHEERIALALEGKAHLIAKVREPAPAKRASAQPRYANQSGGSPPGCATSSISKHGRRVTRDGPALPRILPHPGLQVRPFDPYHLLIIGA